MSVISALLLVGIVALLALVIGGGLGAALTPRILERRRRRATEQSGITVSQMLDHIVSGSPVGIVVVDTYRDVVYTNDRARELGLVRDRLLDDRAWLAAERTLATGEAGEVDLSPRKRANPGRSGLSVRGQVRLLTEEDRRFAVVYVDDQSEHARMEATRRDFVANVSHELKTPVGAMGVLAEALLASADDPDNVRRFAEKMVAESNRLANMVGELIDLSRLQGGERLPDLDAVDVDTVVSEALSRYKVAADNADIAITTDAPTGYRVMGDGSLLVTAIANLVSNAIAYSPNGSSVSVSRRRRGPNVEIAVTDRGIGIAREDQERVFERFFRVDKARSRATGGTGLGLAIVKHVAANHNGSIRLWSQPGTGSTFTLSIPAYPEHEDDVGRARGLARQMTSVLIVEDEESLADPLAFLLRKEGFEATVVADGPSALAEFERAGADIVLLDLMLPGMSGTDVCKQLRSRSSVPVIMVTARDSEIDKVVGLELGADDYVTKPYSARELIARIRAVLRRGNDNDDSGVGDGILEAGPVRMDVERHVVSVNGEAITLPLKEFDLLEYLMRNSGRVLTRGQLIDRVWGADYVGDTKTLDVHVKRLRSKIEADPANPVHLVTVRGLGYKLEG